jgi:enoyl-CoA hydratase
MEDFSTLTIEREERVLVITLSRPDLLNRFDLQLHREFRAALELLSADREVRTAVLASTGRAFSAGGDFEMIVSAQGDPDLRHELVHDARELLAALIDVPQPIVVAMQGAAIGLGATVALACDAVVAPRQAELADSHVVAGLVAGDGGCLVWPAAAGMLRARRHLLTGDPLTAEEAFSLGLVTDLVETPDEVLPAARALAQRIAALPPIAVQGTKRALNRVTAQRAGEVLDLSVAYEETSLASEDVLEAIAALKERRAGEYHGR